MMKIYLQSICLFSAATLIVACSATTQPEELSAPPAKEVVAIAPATQEPSVAVPISVEVASSILTQSDHNISVPGRQESHLEKIVESVTTPVPPPPPVAESQLVVAPRQTESLTRTYIVKGGETLWTIAARPELYGDALLWSLLYQANRDQIKDPRQIYPEQVLSVPRDLTEDELQAAREWARKSEVFPIKNGSIKSP